MLTCREAALLMSKELDCELPLLSRLLLRFHLAVCRSCRIVRRQLALIKGEAADQTDLDRVPGDALREPQLTLEQKDRLKKALQDEQDPSPL